MRQRADFAHFSTLTRAVVERVVHTTADPSWVGEIVADETAVHAGRNALLGGGPIVVDVRMVAAGITARTTHVGLDQPEVDELAQRAGITRSAAGIRRAALDHPSGAVWVIGNAPTALTELLRLAENDQLRPALVVGVPVGFVGAVEAKAALRRSGIPAVSTLSERGGAAIAAGAVNGLLYWEDSDSGGIR